MPRIRSLKPGFCTSEAITALSIPCRLHFAMLWTYADDAGRGADNPRLIKAALWPLDDDVDLEQIEAWQDELERNGRIERYDAGGKRFFSVNNFHEHQKPNRPVASVLPEPPDTAQCASSVPAVSGHGDGAAVGEGRGEVVVGLPHALGVNEDDDLSTELSSEVWDHVVAIKERLAGGSKPPRWRVTTRGNAIAELANDARTIAATYDLNPLELAEVLTGQRDKRYLRRRDVA